jgi:hypothetical protein
MTPQELERITDVAWQLANYHLTEEGVESQVTLVLVARCGPPGNPETHVVARYGGSTHEAVRTLAKVASTFLSELQKTPEVQ